MNHDKPLSASEEKLLRWVDGDLSGPELAAFEREIDAHPEWADEKSAAAQIGRALRQHVPAAQEPPYPDFFNSQLLHRIRDEQAAGEKAAPSAAPGGFSAFWQWLRAPWTLVGATAVAVTLVSAVWLRSGADTGTRVLSAYSPEAQARAKTFYSHEAHASVIDIAGLEAYPTDRPIVGYQESNEGAALIAALPE